MYKRTRYFLVVLILLPLFISMIYMGCKSTTEPDLTTNETDEYKSIIQTAVHTTAVGFGNVFNNVIIGRQNKENFMRAYINFNQFLKDSSGYFYVNNFDGINIAHGVNLSLQGQDRSNVKDNDGKFYLRELLSNAQNNIYEFVTYNFLNPATQDTEKKYGYSEQVLGDYALSSGFYLAADDEYVSDSDRDKIIMHEIGHTLAYGSAKTFAGIITDQQKQYSFYQKFVQYNRFFDDLSGYIFVIDLEGNTIANGAQKNLEGTNILTSRDGKGKYYIREMINIAKNSGAGYVEYYMRGETKVSYVERVANTNYFVGVGVN